MLPVGHREFERFAVSLNGQRERTRADVRTQFCHRNLGYRDTIDGDDTVAAAQTRPFRP